MDTILAAVALGAGVLGLVFASVYRSDWRARGRALKAMGLWPVLLMALVAVVAAFLLTLPMTPPFSTGLTLGWGALIGGLLGLYALVESAGNFEGDAWNARMAGLLSAAVVGPSLVLLLFRGYPTEALAGCALGAALVAGLASGILRSRGDDSAPVYRGVEVYALATAAVVVGARLGIDHFPRVTPASAAGAYWVFPALALAAGMLVIVLLTGNRLSALLSGALASLGVVIVAAALGAKLLPELAWPLPLFGLFVFMMVGWALWKDESSASDAATYRPATLAFGTALLTLAVMAAAFTYQGMHGYGQALALLGALPIAAALYLTPTDRTSLSGSLPMGAFTIALLLALYRAYMEGAGRGWTLEFQEQYNLLSLLLGAGTGFGVMAYLTRGARRPVMQTLRTLVLGLVLAAAPLALAALWGAKATGAFLAGLVIAEVLWIFLAAWVTGTERRRTLLAAPHIFLIGAALVAMQFTPLLLAQELTRTSKLILVAVLAAIGVAWIMVDGLTRDDKVTG